MDHANPLENSSRVVIDIKYIFLKITVLPFLSFIIVVILVPLIQEKLCEHVDTQNINVDTYMYMYLQLTHTKLPHVKYYTTDSQKKFDHMNFQLRCS